MRPYKSQFKTYRHVLFHRLGAPHDGVGKSESCPKKGYMMSDGTVEKTNHWSECSIKTMQENIR